jgi:pantothenate kinase type III
LSSGEESDACTDFLPASLVAVDLGLDRVVAGAASGDIFGKTNLVIDVLIM